MSSLRLISHHLFVSAIGRSSSADEELELTGEQEESGTAIALEVLDDSEPFSELTARPLLASGVQGVT